MNKDDLKNPSNLRNDSLYMNLLQSKSPQKQAKTAHFSNEFDSPETKDLKRLCAENEALKQSIMRSKQMGSAGAPMSSQPNQESDENSVINPYRVNMYQGEPEYSPYNNEVDNSGLSPVRQTIQEEEEEELDLVYAHNINEE